MIDQAFWHATESTFYQHLNTLANQTSENNQLPGALAKYWVELLLSTATSQFDFWVLEGDIEDRNMKRIFESRQLLLSKMKTMKSLKPLWQRAAAFKQNQQPREVA